MNDVPSQAAGAAGHADTLPVTKAAVLRAGVPDPTGEVLRVWLVMLETVAPGSSGMSAEKKIGGPVWNW